MDAAARGVRVLSRLAASMQISEYDDLAQIGAGAQGTTYRARHRESGDIVALKRLELRGLSEWKPVERFEREAKVLRSLSHPGVVRFIDAFEAGDEPAFFIVSEFVEGPTLGALIAQGHRWDEEAATGLLQALLETLAYLHGLSPRVVHRDLKPGNVVMTDGAHPVLIDFGSVSDVGGRTDGGLTLAGTVGYMAPEQAMGAVDPRSDLFALGATVVHALTHVHPSELPRDGLRFDLGSRLGCSQRLRGILERLLEPDPSARFQTASEALAAIRDDAPKQPAAKRALAVRSPSSLVPAAPRAITPALRETISLQRTFSSLSKLQRLPYVMLAAGGSWAAIFLLSSVSTFGPILGMVSFILFILGGLVWLRRSVLQAYATGEDVLGEVEGITNHQGAYIVKFGYNVGGERLQGKFVSRDMIAVRDVSRGDPVHVFYKPGSPRRVVALLPAELEPDS